jgi:hypothetical protein
MSFNVFLSPFSSPPTCPFGKGRKSVRECVSVLFTLHKQNIAKEKQRTVKNYGYAKTAFFKKNCTGVLYQTWNLKMLQAEKLSFLI